MLRSFVPVVLLVLVVSGCRSSSGDSSTDPTFTRSESGSSDPIGAGQSDIDLRFEYLGVATTGSIDQTLTIANPSRDVAAVPTLSFQALDADGNPLAGLKVTTIFGSDKGWVMAPANYEVFDILRFEGVGVELVKDVEVTVQEMHTLDESGTTYPEVDYLDAQGRSVDFAYEAHAVRVRNPGTSEYLVRLVGIRWNQPAAGQSQQARHVSGIGEPVSIDARGFVDIPLPARSVGRFDSLKAYISVQ